MSGSTGSQWQLRPRVWRRGTGDDEVVGEEKIEDGSRRASSISGRGCDRGADERKSQWVLEENWESLFREARLQGGASDEQGQIFKGFKKDEAQEEAIQSECPEVIHGLCHSRFHEVIGYRVI